MMSATATNDRLNPLSPLASPIMKKVKATHQGEQNKGRPQSKFKQADVGKNLRRDSIISDRTLELRILTRQETSAFLGSGLGSQRKNF